MKTAALFLLALPAFCQNGGAGIVSPEILPDHRVTFRIAAPKAAEVTFTGDWITGAADKPVKDDKGVWSLTLGPLPPATYIYSFTVDGTAMADPVNPRIKLRARGSGSLFDVPADTPAMWQAQNVPHGDVQINWHKATALNNETKSFWVYTPPDYAKDTTKRYPVLYLLHGSNDTQAGWTTAGSVNQILDNLIAAKKAVPMIIVMPFGHAIPFGGRGPAGGPSNTELYEKYLLTDVIPAVEAKYRVIANRENRAVAGQSMGGEQSFAIGFGHTELFASIGGLSPSMPRELAARWEGALADSKGTNAKMKVIWIGCGRQDPSHLSASRSLAKSMQDHGVKYTYTETEGAHNYAMWQLHMIEFAPMLFR